MAALRVKENGTFSLVGSGAASTASAWTRNPAWPALTAPSASEQKIVGLYAVWPGDGVGNGGNFFAFNAQGAYTINYGDGTTTSYASNTQANYEFNFNNSALASTNAPVTFTASTGRVNCAEHGLTNGAEVKFYNIVTTTGLLESTSYYVINASLNDFQISASIGGSAVSFAGDGSATLLPYKIAVVTITPQSGQNLTVVNFQAKHTQTGLQAYSTGWLDLAISAPNVTGTGFTLGGGTVTHRYCESVNIIAVGALTSFANMFQTFSALALINALPNASAVTSMSGMFQNCLTLQTIPSFPGSVAAVTTMASMFSGCVSLQTIPPFPSSVAAVTSMSSMFQNCSSLQTIPPFPVSVAAVTNMSQMFINCSSLQSISPFPGSLAAVANMNSIFSGCSSLQTIPVMNCTGVTSAANMSSAFASLPSLARIQAFNQRFTFSVASCKLSAVALNELFTGLPTVTGQTITVSGNYGANQAGYDPSIATAKGWTVA